MPPLETEDFPHFNESKVSLHFDNFEGGNNINHVDNALEEILSISQELIHSSNYTNDHNWFGTNYSHLDEFTSLLEGNEGAAQFCQTSDCVIVGEPTKMVEIGGLKEREVHCDSTEVRSRSLFYNFKKVIE